MLGREGWGGDFLLKGSGDIQGLLLIKAMDIWQLRIPNARYFQFYMEAQIMYNRK